MQAPQIGRFVLRRTAARAYESPSAPQFLTHIVYPTSTACRLHVRRQISEALVRRKV